MIELHALKLLDYRPTCIGLYKSIAASTRAVGLYVCANELSHFSTSGSDLLWPQCIHWERISLYISYINYIQYIQYNYIAYSTFMFRPTLCLIYHMNTENLLWVGLLYSWNILNRLKILFQLLVDSFCAPCGHKGANILHRNI